ncbi:unnamed protein product [Lota lota]
MHANASRDLPLARLTRVLLFGFGFVGTALLVLILHPCSTHLDGDKQRLVTAPRIVREQPALPSDQPPEKPVAFLSKGVLLVERSATQSPGNVTVVLWRKKLLRGGFLYTNGSLQVPRTGRYRVSFQLTYRNHGEVLCNTKTLMLTQQVVWIQKSYQADIPLLLVQDTVPCDLTIFSKTLQATAAFDLSAGDLLRVQINNPRLLKREGFLGVDLDL